MQYQHRYWLTPSILIDLDRRGLKIAGNTTYSQQDNQLTAHLTLDIPNAQIATFIPDWNKMNQALAAGDMDKEDYDIWLEDTLKLFNVPIDEYIWLKPFCSHFSLLKWLST